MKSLTAVRLAYFAVLVAQVVVTALVPLGVQQLQPRRLVSLGRRLSMARGNAYLESLEQQTVETSTSTSSNKLPEAPTEAIPTSQTKVPRPASTRNGDAVIPPLSPSSSDELMKRISMATEYVVADRHLDVESTQHNPTTPVVPNPAVSKTPSLNAEDDEEEISEVKKLMQQVKDAGTAGIISYALWELGFWLLSVPVVLLGYIQFTGHFPDFSNQDDVSKLGAEAFAFVNLARFAVPLRIGLALSTTPWIQKNILDRFFSGK